jgi:hypothetical protein
MRKSSPPPRRKSPQSPSITNRPKSEPLPARRSSLSPRQIQQSLLRPLLTSPRQSPQKANLSSIPDDIRLKVLSKVLKSETTLLNNELIEKLSILQINKSFKETIKSYCEKYYYIALRNITITKDLLGILEMTDSNKIVSIILRGISFDSSKTLKKFLVFFSKNKMLSILVLDNIKIKEGEFKNLLEKIKNLKNLYFFEINNITLPSDAFTLFKEVVINNLKLLQYLQFTNNTVATNFCSQYNTFFTEYKDNIIKVNENDYNVYMLRENTDLQMIIKNVRDPLNVKTISINVTGNRTILIFKDHANKLPFKLIE